MSLKKKLTRHGNSLALVIERPILDLLGIDSSTPLTISSPDGCSLVITPEDRMPKKGARFDKELTLINKKYKKVLKELADK
ncbi:MAG: hypothetical protein KR126chlam2_01019 [Chlamydiae bacterium]|nr:hypothetical protein [Chlamydiota bacterium]